LDFKKVIYERESVRDYDPNKSVDKETLDQILEAGRMAPSANNRQPWLFLLISSPENLKRIKECYDKEWYKNALHVLVVVGDKSAAWVRQDGYNAIETDLTIAMDHLILAAGNLGVGTCWIANFDDNKLRETLQLNEDQVVFALTPLGYPHNGYQKRKKIRKPIEEVVRYM
jgi:nitroreductase